jgi:uncharacterized membrane protein YuzA (DUF378 family)
MCFVLVLIGAINWLVCGAYRIYHRRNSTLALEPIEDLFAWVQHLIGQESTFYFQNGVYILVGIAAIFLLLARFTVIVETKIDQVRETRQAYVQ